VPAAGACDEPTAFAPTSTSAGSGGFNAVIGTQTFNPSYRLTRKPRLMETAEAIRGVGGDTIKFQLSPTYARGNGNVDMAHGGILSLTDLVRDEHSHRAVLDMPFSRFVLWACRRSLASRGGGCSSVSTDSRRSATRPRNRTASRGRSCGRGWSGARR
jgi:hypothetical protein